MVLDVFLVLLVNIGMDLLVFHAPTVKFGILKLILVDAHQVNIGPALFVLHALTVKFGIL